MPPNCYSVGSQADPDDLPCYADGAAWLGAHSWHVPQDANGSIRQRGDMKELAHIREQYGLSLGSAVYPERPPCGQSKGLPSHDDGT